MACVHALVHMRRTLSTSYQLRVVSLHTWKGRRSVDIRSFGVKQPGLAVPTKRGARVDVERLPALLEALRLAQQPV